MTPLVTDRDLDILAALERFPLTAFQLLTLSQTFPQPFTDERRVRERLQVLVAAKRIRQFRYAIAGPGSPAYYLLSPEGYALLRGPDALPPSKRAFSELSVSRQAHAFYLAEFLVHFIVQARR
ncbi:MAG TPA: replication-relaxation family protein, partial [Gemmatales bacterium]|nr:replication-relaxation family protein [Gemmatales bacterium]